MSVPLETPARIVRELTAHGLNAEPEAVTLIAGTDRPAETLAAVLEATDDDALAVEADVVRSVLAGDAGSSWEDPSASGGDNTPTPEATVGTPRETRGADETEQRSGPVGSPDGTGASASGTAATAVVDAQTSASVDAGESSAAAEVEDARPPIDAPDATDATDPSDAVDATGADRSVAHRSVEVHGDVTGESTGTGEYEDFVSLFLDRYDRLSRQLRGRVNHVPTNRLESRAGGGDAALVGMVDDVRPTANGHWLVDLEDPNGTFPVLITKDRDVAEHVDELLCDELIAVEGTLSDDAGILFVDDLHFPEVPRTFEPSTADRHVQAALISDVHVGSQEFMADAWERFADWLHTPEAETVEYLLIAGDMVEGVGVYPDQDEELSIVDIYDQYEAFSERLKSVPGDLDVIMIPGNHDAVRLAEPQPAFDEELREIMSAHDARITGNPSTVEVEGVSILMYHGVSLDEVIAELPDEKATYDEPEKPMYQLLRKRHLAPQYGGHMRLAPEKEDYLVIDEVPDVFHTGHVHKLGYGKYRNVLSINSGCWQAQTDFQRSVNIDPDAGFAPIVDLDTLDVTIRKFA